MNVGTQDKNTCAVIGQWAQLCVPLVMVCHATSRENMVVVVVGIKLNSFVVSYHVHNVCMVTIRAALHGPGIWSISSQIGRECQVAYKRSFRFVIFGSLSN